MAPGPRIPAGRRRPPDATLHGSGYVRWSARHGESGLETLSATGAPSRSAGTLFVQPWARATTQQPWQRLDDVVGFRWLIAVTHPAIWHALPANTQQRWADLGGTWIAIEPNGSLHERDGIFHDWCKAHQATAVIVRPDRYVYGSVDHAAQMAGLVAQVVQALQEGGSAAQAAEGATPGTATCGAA